MFGKRRHRDGRMFHGLEPVAICDQFPHFEPRQRKHEGGWESLNIPFNLFVKALGLNAIQFRQVAIEHHLDAANCEDARLDEVIGDGNRSRDGNGRFVFSRFRCNKRCGF